MAVLSVLLTASALVVVLIGQFFETRPALKAPT